MPLVRRIAILGPPNAGKSSLLNTLARRPAAIVSPVAGTTRDVVEVALNLKGFPVVLYDTAGIRETECVVEREGVLRAQETGSVADLKVLVIDADEAMRRDAPIEAATQSFLGPSTILVLNKADLIRPERDRVQEWIHKKIESHTSLAGVWVISCSTGVGLDGFIAALGAEVEKRLSDSGPDEIYLTRERHRVHLQRCSQALGSFLEYSVEVDLAAEELRAAVMELGRITGRVDVEEILDVLFKDFCIGK